MNSRKIISICFLLTTLFVGSLACQTNTEQPNIVFILADDLGWKDLGCYGNQFIETPNIDKLAENGIRFMQAYAVCPVCSPTSNDLSEQMIEKTEQKLLLLWQSKIKFLFRRLIMKN